MYHLKVTQVHQQENGKGSPLQRVPTETMHNVNPLGSCCVREVLPRVGHVCRPPKWTPANMGLGIQEMLCSWWFTFVHYLEWAATWLDFLPALAGFYKALESLCLLQCRQNLLLSPNRAGNSARKVPHISNVLAERYLGNMKGWNGHYFGLYSVSSKRLPGPPKYLPRDIPKKAQVGAGANKPAHTSPHALYFQDGAREITK